MEPNVTNDPRTSNWLDRIQQDSWQLELLVSGFAIFLLIGGWAPYQKLLRWADVLTAESSAYYLLLLTLLMLSVAYAALIGALVVHVILRGVWIAAVGLRSVSGDIDYDELGYRRKFHNFLAGSIGSFDAYIIRLERWCSVAFSLAFLIIFCFVSLTSYFLFVMGLQWLFLLVTGGEWTGRGVFGNSGIINLITIIVGLIYMIDFFTVGWLKRNRTLAGVYYPLYRFVGWITLAALYRPLYHNLIDDRFGRRLARLLPVAVLGIMVLVSLRVVTNGYFPYYAADGRVWIDHYNYDDAEPDLLGQSWRVTLASKYADRGYVEMFAPYQGRILDPLVRRVAPDLAPARFTGIRMGEPLKVSGSYNEDVAAYPELLTTVTSLYRCYVNDSLRADVRPRFHFHPGREQAGLLYVIPVHDLPPGEHTVRLEQQRLRADTLYWRPQPTIYFYR